jgi:hypothetical protein
MLAEMLFSLVPYDVVITDGGLATPSRKVAVSRRAVRKLLLPLDRKVTGTPVATPTVYWVSRLASVLHIDY